MLAFIVGLLCGIVITIACFGAAFVLFAGKVDNKEPVKKQPEKKDVLEVCRQQAQMQNFWAYDGTKQRDSDEIARHLYDQVMATRPKKTP